MKVRPYRYPHVQKIEVGIDVVLIVEVIQPSTSPYSSLVLLVKKKDGSWWLSENFWVLNNVPISNTFPIPIFWKIVEGTARVTNLF